MFASRRVFLGGLATAFTGRAGYCAPAGSVLPAGARGALSLTYDDGVDSQLEYAVPALDRHGLKATFFLTEQNMAGRLADWARVAAEGHEVADHTVSHPCKLVRYGSEEFLHREIQPMEAFLDSNFGPDRVRTFAYPCGLEGLGSGARSARRARYLRVLKDEIVAARTVDGPPNELRSVERRRFDLNGFEPTYDQDDPRPAIRYLRRTQAMGGWAILVFHRILPERQLDGDTSVHVHEEILQWIAKAPLWCAPMGEAFDRLSGRAAPDRKARLDRTAAVAAAGPGNNASGPARLTVAALAHSKIR